MTESKVPERGGIYTLTREQVARAIYGKVMEDRFPSTPRDRDPERPTWESLDEVFRAAWMGEADRCVAVYAQGP